MKIAYIVSNLKRVGPSNQTLNIIKNSEYKKTSIVITLFNETEDSMIEEYQKNNIEVICLNLNKKNIFFIGYKKLKKELLKRRIEIAHSYGIFPDYCTNKATRNISIHHIITLRNFPKEDILTRMNFLFSYFALFIHLTTLKQSKHVICCSESIYKKMKEKYKKMNLSYIQNGVDLNKYINRSDMINKEKLGIDKKDVVFISTGSFIKRKRIQETIELFNLLPEKNKKLLLLGDGPLYNEIYIKNKMNDKIIFVGKVSNVADYLSISNYFLSSSESEGLPNSVLESIACGVPVILSDIPQHIEILKHLDKVGFTYKLGVPYTCLDLYLKFDSEEYNEIQKNTSNIIDSPFNMKNMSKKYNQYYDEIIQGRQNENK